MFPIFGKVTHSTVRSVVNFVIQIEKVLNILGVFSPFYAECFYYRLEVVRLPLYTLITTKSVLRLLCLC